MTLNDYRVAPGVMFMSRSDSQLTIAPRSLRLNGVCHDKLGYGRFIEVLYHPIMEVIAIRNCDETSPNAILWDEANKKPLQLCTSAFSTAVYEKLEWMRKYKFRFRGVTRVRDGEKIIFFFLDEPQILVGKDKKRLDENDTSESRAKFIPYKEGTTDEDENGVVSPIAYPENWRDHFGVSYEIKRKRERIINEVSSSDISYLGTRVINPFIGEIPSQEQLEAEVEELYMSM